MNVVEIDLFEELKKELNKDLYTLIFDESNSISLIGENKLIAVFSDIYTQRGGNVAFEYGYDSNEIKKGVCSLDHIISSEIMKRVDKKLPMVILGPHYTYLFLKLKAIGFENIYSFLSDDIAHINNYYRIVRNKEKIIKMYISLEDLRSREVIKDIFMARIYNDLNYIANIQDKNADNEYFDKKIVPLSNDETFIDAGAYNGDTLYKFLKNTNSSFREIYLFEPDTNNFFMLDNQLTSGHLVSSPGKTLHSIDLKSVAHNIHIFNSGIYSEASKLRFTGNLCMASHVKDNIDMPLKNEAFSDDVIDVVKLDDVLKDKEVTYIKMDIEGSEYEAIIGSKNIIAQNKPKLAVCVYHKEHHLWDIPLLIKELNPDYKIFIRHYNSNLWDTICYAVS